MSLAAVGALGGGALLGGISGWMSNEQAKDALRTQRETIKKLKGSARVEAEEALRLAEAAYAKRFESAGGQDSLNKLQALINQFEATDTELKPEDFVYDKDVKDFYDPAAEFRQKKAAEATQQSLAGQGNLFSGGAGRQLASEAQELASEEWGKSYERMTTDKNSAYQQYKDKIQLAQDNLKNLIAKNSSMIDIYGKKEQQIYGAEDTYIQRQLDANQQLSQTLMDLGLTEAQVQAAISQRAGFMGAAAATVGGAAGGMQTGANIYSALS
jgi:hypothetical protein